MSELFIKDKDILTKIEVDEVYFFVKRNSKVYAVMVDGNIEINSTLYYVSGLLGKNFIRSHRGYIINMNKIDEISKISAKTYNVSFKGILDIAYITSNNLKLIAKRYSII